MSPTKKDSRRGSDSESGQAAPQRPKTLLQRLSSGFSSILPTITLRKGRSKTNLHARPTTAPVPSQAFAHTSVRGRFGLPDSQQIFVPQLNIPRLSEPEYSCPYDASTYHSFSSIEQKQCDFCGLRPPSRASFGFPSSSRPCSHCRARRPFSHLATGFKRSHGHARSNSAVESSLTQLIGNSSSSEEVPRTVPAAIVAARSGNPPRTVSLPSNRVPSYNRLRLPSAHDGALASSQGLIGSTPSKASSSGKACSRTFHNNDARPISPKLHHLDILPGVHDHPFVHKHEVDAHMAALRAGVPSPLRRSINEARMSATAREPYQDYSRTVFYGTTTTSASARRLPVTGDILQRIEASGTIVIEEGRRGGIPTDLNRELENSGVYRRRSPQQNTNPSAPLHQDDDSFSTLTTQTPSTVGGTRLELKGGNEKLKLRGGGRGFRLKKWLLTCQVPCGRRCMYDENSEDDLPPARTPAPERIARAMQRARGTVALPTKLARVSSDTSHAATPSRRVREHTDASNVTIHHYLPAHFRSRGAGSPGIHSFPNTHSSPIPNLRGGAGSAVRLPPTLYWLAGGKGRPVTISSWQKQKGKKRAGGLLGRVMYGAKSGTEYDSDAGESSGGSGRSSVRATVGPRSVSVQADEEVAPAVAVAEGAAPADIALPETPAERTAEGGVDHTIPEGNAGQTARN